MPVVSRRRSIWAASRPKDGDGPFARTPGERGGLRSAVSQPAAAPDLDSPEWEWGATSRHPCCTSNTMYLQDWWMPRHPPRANANRPTDEETGRHGIAQYIHESLEDH